MKKDFGVESHYGELLVAFTNECKKFGWRFNSGFSGTLIAEAVIDSGKSATCIYFADGWNSGIADRERNGCFFAPSNTSNAYKLPEQWNEALAHAKEYITDRTKPTVKLNSEYTAEVDREKKVVRVGCQTIPFSAVKELAKHCK